MGEGGAREAGGRGVQGHKLTRVLLGQVWVQQGANGGHAKAALQAG